MSAVVRNKPGLFGWLLRIAGILIALAITAYVVMYAFARSAVSRWEKLAADLRDKGHLLTYEEIQAARPHIPPEENGAEIIRNTFAILDQISEPDKEGVYVLDDDCRDDFFEGLDRSCLPASRAYVQARQEALNEVSKLGQYEHVRLNISYDATMFEMMNKLMEFTSAARYLSKLLYLDARLHTIDGEASKAIDGITLQVRLSEPMYDEPATLLHLVAIAIDAVAIRSVEGLLAAHELTSDELTRIEQIWEQHQHVQDIRASLLDLRASIIRLTDMDQATANMRANLRANNMPVPSPGPIQTLWDSLPYYDWFTFGNRTRGVEYVTLLIEGSDDLPRLLTEARTMAGSVSAVDPRSMFARITLPSLTRAIELHARLIAQTRCLLTALAAERFRMATGRFPESLNELTPDYLDEVPLDPFDGKTLRLVQTDEGIVIYSIGENGLDDGGRLVREQTPGPRMPDVGFRLLHPGHRGIRFIEDTPETPADE